MIASNLFYILACDRAWSQSSRDQTEAFVYQAAVLLVLPPSILVQGHPFHMSLEKITFTLLHDLESLISKGPFQIYFVVQHSNSKWIFRLYNYQQNNTPT